MMATQAHYANHTNQSSFHWHESDTSIQFRATENKREANNAFHAAGKSI